jgi:hypothetical protein
VAIAAGASAIVIAIPSVAIALGRAPEVMTAARQGNTGLGPQCVSDTGFTFDRRCSTGDAPTLLVWGDSYAMHLVPGIVQERGSEQVAQATKYICGPLLGASQISHQPGSVVTRPWAEDCIRYNNDVFNFVKRTPSIQTVVLASVFDGYVSDETGIYWQGKGETAGGVGPAIEGLRHTVGGLRALGKKVIIVGPPPALKWDAGQCAERRIRGLPTFGKNRDCNIPDRDYRIFRAKVLQLMAEVPRQLDVDVIMFDDYLRQEDHYVTWPTRKIWFITNGHLSYQGSRDIVRGMEMVPTILAKAR